MFQCIWHSKFRLPAMVAMIFFLSILPLVADSSAVKVLLSTYEAHFNEYILITCYNKDIFSFREFVVGVSAKHEDSGPFLWYGQKDIGDETNFTVLYRMNLTYDAVVGCEVDIDGLKTNNVLQRSIKFLPNPALPYEIKPQNMVDLCGQKENVPECSCTGTGYGVFSGMILIQLIIFIILNYYLKKRRIANRPPLALPVPYPYEIREQHYDYAVCH